jgi:signal transduction histidine kinase
MLRTAAVATAEPKESPGVGVLIAERLLVAGLKAQERADESEAARRRLAFLFKASQQLAASHEPASTVQALVQLIVPEFGDGCLIHLLERGRDGYRTTVASTEALRPLLFEWKPWLERETRTAMNAALRYARSGVGSTYRTRRTAAPQGFGDASYLCVPLQSNGPTLGALIVFALGSRQSYAHEDLVVGEALGSQAGMALENAQLHEEQRLMIERLDHVRNELDGAQAEWLRGDERRRIARELHDHVEQTFFAIGLAAKATLDKRGEQGPDDTCLADSLARAGDLASAGAEQLRAAIFALNHAEFAGPSLIPALWNLVRSFQQRTSIDADLVLTGTQRNVPTEVAEALHAMAREALANVERHSRAAAVVLALHISTHFITLTVHDDGAGASRLLLKRIGASTTHFGLRGVRERVQRQHGRFVAGPGPDGGFLVRARIPLQSGDTE